MLERRLPLLVQIAALPDQVLQRVGEFRVGTLKARGRLFDLLEGLLGCTRSCVRSGHILVLPVLRRFDEGQLGIDREPRRTQAVDCRCQQADHGVVALPGLVGCAHVLDPAVSVGCRRFGIVAVVCDRSAKIDPAPARAPDRVRCICQVADVVPEFQARGVGVFVSTVEAGPQILE